MSDLLDKLLELPEYKLNAVGEALSHDWWIFKQPKTWSRHTLKGLFIAFAKELRITVEIYEDLQYLDGAEALPSKIANKQKQLKAAITTLKKCYYVITTGDFDRLTENEFKEFERIAKKGIAQLGNNPEILYKDYSPDKHFKNQKHTVAKVLWKELKDTNKRQPTAALILDLFIELDWEESIVKTDAGLYKKRVASLNQLLRNSELR